MTRPAATKRVTLRTSEIRADGAFGTRSPADRRPVGGPFSLGGYLGRREHFRGGHHADADHRVEVVFLRPLGEPVPGRSRIRMVAARQYACTVNHVTLVLRFGQGVHGRHRDNGLGHRPSIAGESARYFAVLRASSTTPASSAVSK